MKCQRCDKMATFHITELTGDVPEEVHLCADHAQEYLSPDEAPQPPSIPGMLAKQLKVSQTAEELAELDQRECPVCGITFYEFRQHGRLGCPHDYTFFEDELEPLILNIHGKTEHTGKTPKKTRLSADAQTRLIRLRRDMKDAIEVEDYERASEIRDEIRSIEQEDSS